MAKRKNQTGGATAKPVSRRQVQFGEVVRDKKGRKVNRVTANKPDKAGRTMVGVKYRGSGLDKIKGATFYSPSGKRIAKKDAIRQNGYLKAGHTMRSRNRGRTGTRLQELVGGGEGG